MNNRKSGWTPQDMGKVRSYIKENATSTEETPTFGALPDSGARLPGTIREGSQHPGGERRIGFHRPPLIPRGFLPKPVRVQGARCDPKQWINFLLVLHRTVSSAEKRSAENHHRRDPATQSHETA